MLGFNELFGVKLEKIDYISRVFSDICRRNSYSQISVPIVEQASSYSEEIIGESPWPEWNKKGCFYFNIEDYKNDYSEIPNVIKALLVPEGTISITRWLGEGLDSQKVILPIKVFYEMKCFRNELISTLSKTKGREFLQFGMEIMGDNSIMAEIETIILIVCFLEKLGICNNSIRIRLNDVSIFNQLIEDCGLQNRRIIIKEQLDSLAEVKAGKKTERRDQIVKSLYTEISSLSETLKDKWESIINQKEYKVEEASYVFGETYAEKFNKLVEIQDAFAKFGIIIDLDLCVIRSHEYYTSISFEVDVKGKEQKFIEIAGGGRYDRLVSNFINSEDAPDTVPCVGFAFGVERVIDLLETENLYPKEIILSSEFTFEDYRSGYDKDVSRLLALLQEYIKS